MYWPLLNMYSENFGFGPGGFYYWGYLYKSGEVIGRIQIEGPVEIHGMRPSRLFVAGSKAPKNLRPSTMSSLTTSAALERNGVHERLKAQ